MNRFFTLFIIISATLSSSCYRMATENDYSIVPMTNNPDITRESQGVCSPNVKF